MRKILAVAVLWMTGCATVPAEPIRGRFDARGLQGEHVSLVRAPRQIVGEALARPVRLELAPDEVRGVFNDQRVRLRVEPEGDALRVTGEFDGAGAAFRASPGRLEGFVGGCAFLLQSGGPNTYRGPRKCGVSRAREVSVTLPALLPALPPAERAAWLALLLLDPSHRTVAGAAGAYDAAGEDGRILFDVPVIRERLHPAS